jgi:hypothetical protein
MRTGVGMAAIAAMASVAGAAAAASSDEIEIGRRIYQEGVLSTGAPLSGLRFEDARVAGSEAACVRCHRPSGMGSVEGNVLVSPINATYLFNTSQKGRATMDPHVGKLLNQYHPPYTDEALALAIRSGLNNAGVMMNSMMPHYELPEAEMKALLAYLRQLTTQWSPGVTADRLRLATVITPGVDAARRKVFIEMMRTAVTQKNGSTAQGARHMVSPAEMLLRTERKWDLDIWELSGEPQTWPAQLQARYQAQPVFALVSGLSDGPWQPVHDFCEQQRVPCWFPSLELPPAIGKDRYSLYFSRGVALDAEVLAQQLRQAAPGSVSRVVQLLRDDPVGRGAAQALQQAMTGSGIAVQTRLVDGSGAAALRQALRGTGAGDALVLWLRPADIAALAEIAPPAVTSIYLSASLSNGEHGYPPAWKAVAHLVYPWELPARRELNLAYFHAWLKSRHLPLVDEAMQSQVYFALTFFTDTQAEMLDNLYRDYLLERAEDMLSRREASRAEEEARDRPNLGARAPYAGNRAPSPQVPMALRPPPVAVGVSQSTTIYPRLSLGQGQRHASKGAYIVRFAGVDSDALEAETEWILP